MFLYNFLIFKVHLLDFPNIVIKGSELQLPFQACLKVFKILINLSNPHLFTSLKGLSMDDLTLILLCRVG